MTSKANSSRQGRLATWVLLVAFLVAGCSKPQTQGPGSSPPGPVSSDGPIVVGKGAGQAEFAILFIYENHQSLFRQCHALCGLNADEDALLRGIEREFETPDLFKPVFKSKRELGTDVVRRRDREIWFNQDELWLNESKTVAYDLPAAMSLWLEVLSSPIYPPVNADALGGLKGKLKALMGNETRYAEFKLGTGQIINALLWRQNQRGEASDRLILWDLRSRFLDLTPKALAAADGSGLKFYGMNWSSPVGEGPKELRDLHLEVAASWADQSQRPVRGQIDFMIPLEKDGEKFVLNPDRITALATEE